MSETADPGPDAGPSETVETRTSSGGIAVRKVASLHEAGAVAVYLTLESERLARCRVRVIDALPQPLADHAIEFHPHYDPANWEARDGAAVYEVTLVPDDERMTAYGVMIDDASQLTLFDATPTLEVEAIDDGPVPSEAASAPASTSGPPDDGAEDFSFGESQDAPSNGASAPATDGSNAVLEAIGAASPEGSPAAQAGGSTGEPTDGSLASGADGLDDVAALQGLAERQAALEAELERLESELRTVADALEERQDVLDESLDEVRASVEREASWREGLRRQLQLDPEEE